MSELTVHDVTLQLENLWDGHGENYHIKLLRGSCFPGDFPPAIPQGDVSHLLLVAHLGTCKKQQLNTCSREFHGENAERPSYLQRVE